MPTKRQLIKELGRLEGKLETAESNISSMETILHQLTEERNTWRSKYELLLHTPEYKADTEAAFKRGESHSIRKFQNWLQSVTVTLPQTLQDSNEE